MRRYDLVKCALKGQGLPACNLCSSRFVCLTNIKITEEEKLIYSDIPVFLCNIYNNEEGNEFWKQLKKHLNKNRYLLQRYGRGRNRKERGGTGSHLPIKNCDYYGVYVRESKLVREQRRRQYEDKHITYD